MNFYAGTPATHTINTNGVAAAVSAPNDTIYLDPIAKGSRGIQAATIATTITAPAPIVATTIIAPAHTSNDKSGATITITRAQTTVTTTAPAQNVPATTTATTNNNNNKSDTTVLDHLKVLSMNM